MKQFYCSRCKNGFYTYPTTVNRCIFCGNDIRTSDIKYSSSVYQEAATGGVVLWEFDGNISKLS